MERSKGEIKFPYLRRCIVIIVVAGHPCTGKAQIAHCIGQWAGCQVCYVDDFLRALSLEKEYTVSSPPSGEETERIHRLAMDALYRVAFRHLTHYGPAKCVVIKTRLSSAFEVDLLVKLFKKSWGTVCREEISTFFDDSSIVIVECRIQNEYRWRSQVESLRQREKEEWYKVWSWKDIDKAKEDCLDSHSLDSHLHSSLQDCRFPSTTRLVLDYSDDFSSDPIEHLYGLTPDFQRALIYILEEQRLESREYRTRATYTSEVKLKDMRRYLLDKELDASTKRREYLCTGENSIVECCLFKYRDELELPVDGAEASCCGVCGKKMVLGEPAYTCHFCILNLHSSCAETPLHFTILQDLLDYSVFYYDSRLCEVFTEKQIACKSCNVHGKHFSIHCQTCIFEMHLRCGMLPTIIKHDCHQQHFLSLQCLLFPKGKACNACGLHRSSGYVCHICNFFYDVICIFLPGEVIQVKQEHGGHEHVMKLMYSHDGMDQEDDHWCNACYVEMDPQLWFYSCQDCPYYLTHADEDCVGVDQIEEALRNGNLPIQKLRDKFKLL